MTNEQFELISRQEIKTLLTGFLCEYQNILLSRKINTNEAIHKQNELIDEYAERIGQVIGVTLRNGTLTAEQVREVIGRNVTVYEDGDYDAQEVADELNAQILSERNSAIVEDDDLKAEIVSLMQKKQPYTFNPEAPIENIRTVCRYIDELAAERDKWKAKALGDRIPNDEGTDTREKLEADILASDVPDAHVPLYHRRILGWLNRQAAIAEHDMKACLMRSNDKIAELQAMRYDLETRNRKLQEKVDDLERKIRDLCIAEDEDKAVYEKRIAALEELMGTYSKTMDTKQNVVER